MKVSIIIVSYKMKGLVRNCLHGLREAVLDFPCEIIVVDNDSNDGIEKMLIKEFPEVKFINSGKNLGMGAGNNLGIKEAQGEYVLVLNPDIFVFKNSIRDLVKHLDENLNVALVSPRLLNPDRSLQYTCYRWHKVLTPLFRRTFLGKLKSAKDHLEDFLLSYWDHRGVREVDWVQGSCWLVRKDVLAQVGLFDDRFFMYFEDTDLCRRLWQQNYKVIYHGDVEVIHLHHRQSGGGIKQVLFNKLTRIHLQSWLKYLWKWRRERG